jgi:transcriptional accessory protein Tex/SPT6
LIKPEHYVSEIGLLGLKIIKELEKPGLDPRAAQVFEFDPNVKRLKDKMGMILPGIVITSLILVVS